MNLSTQTLIGAVLSLAFLGNIGLAGLPIPSDGSDQPLNVTSDLVIDLRKAVKGTWSDDNAANAGNGIYDPLKWAVVFKYSSVNIAKGATVTFINHASRAPVVWLVKEGVTIDGTLNLNGQPWIRDAFHVPEPGPGGFRGGAGSDSAYDYGQGSGFGPGGSQNDHAGYLDYRPYGNAQIVPLMGGSGGGGYGSDYSGSGGGGAILIAAPNDIVINGSCVAEGGFSGVYSGSGGAIRLIASRILGNGSLSAAAAYPGRIRLEADTASPDLTINPPVGVASPNPLIIWPEATASTVQVVSIGGQSPPPDPTASITAPATDLTISTTNSVTIVVQTAHFPTNGVVSVYIKPRNSANSTLPATYVSGTTVLATWQATTTLLPAYTVIQARATSN